MLTVGWQNLSAPVTSLLLQAADPDLPRMLRLRARTLTPAAHLPDLHGKTCAQRRRWIPQILWPAWLIRLLPPSGFDADIHRAVLAAALHAPGLPTPITVAQAVATTHPHLQRTTVPDALGRLLDAGHDSVLAALCDLADGLDTYGAPINYHRRRRLITGAGLLSTPQWTRMCEQARMHPGIGRRIIDARRYLFATLTGADLTDPQHRLAYTNAGDRIIYLSFCEHMPLPLRAALLDHAADYLARIDLNEPLTWSPPTDWITSTPWTSCPAVTPADIDLQASLT
jgi:hypothetical protein